MKKNEKKFPGEKKDIILIIGIFLLVLFIASNLSLTGEATRRRTTSTIQRRTTNTIPTTYINKISKILNKGVENIPIRYAKITGGATDYKEDISYPGGGSITRTWKGYTWDCQENIIFYGERSGVTLFPPTTSPMVKSLPAGQPYENVNICYKKELDNNYFDAKGAFFCRCIEKLSHPCTGHKEFVQACDLSNIDDKNSPCRRITVPVSGTYNGRQASNLNLGDLNTLIQCP